MVLKQEGFDTLAVERGIDAGPNPNSDINSIQLNWYKPLDYNSLVYYKIYKSEVPEGNIYYDVLGTTENLLNPLDTVYTDSTQDLTINRRYWYFVTAVNENGVESVPSDTVHYTLSAKAYDLSVNDYSSVVTQPNITFQWYVKNEDIPARGYYLRVEQIVTDDFHPLVFMKEFKTDEVDYTPPQTYEVQKENFRNDMINGLYRWRVDCKGDDLFSGSESDWAIFTVNLGK